MHFPNDELGKIYCLIFGEVTYIYITYLQWDATCPYPEPDQSSPSPIILLKVHLNIILPSMPGFHKSSPSFRFHHQNLYAPLLSLARATCPAHLILFTLISPIIFVKKYGSLRDHSFLFIVFSCPVLCCI